ncbi:hypothetical protein B0H21DRAFT_780500 [Amylocystis lapponica]|nr:hypothetical protein B0H21DRAFT_780500 [Amylocystis lapponica]
MKFTGAAFFASLAALLSSTAAQSTPGLTILSPGGPNLWWVAQSDNTLVWTCSTSPYTNFTILIANSNPSVLSAPFAFISQQPNYDCSETIAKTQINMPVGDGYTIQLANPFNETDVYAVSQPFSIQSLGSAYPPTSATPTDAGSATVSGTGSPTASGASSGAASSQSSKPNGAVSVQGALGGVAAVAAAVGMLLV